MKLFINRVLPGTNPNPDSEIFRKGHRIEAHRKDLDWIDKEKSHRRRHALGRAAERRPSLKRVFSFSLSPLSPLKQDIKRDERTTCPLAISFFFF